MPDRLTPDDEGAELKIRIAFECYSEADLVREALAKLPDLNGGLVWGLPIEPDPVRLIDAELVLIVSDRANLLVAIDRSVNYKQLERAHVLIYLQDVTDIPTEVVTGLTLPRSQLDTALLHLTQTALEPVITPGLVGIDWADLRHILAMGGQVVMERAIANQPEVAIKTAIRQLKDRISGRAIHGLQAAIVCHSDKLETRFVGDLSRACSDVGCADTTLIVAAPLVDSPENDAYEVRLFARVECSGSNWPSTPFINALASTSA